MGGRRQEVEGWRGGGAPADDCRSQPLLSPSPSVSPSLFLLLKSHFSCRFISFFNAYGFSKIRILYFFPISTSQSKASGNRRNVCASHHQHGRCGTGAGNGREGRDGEGEVVQVGRGRNLVPPDYIKERSQCARRLLCREHHPRSNGGL